MTAFRLLFFSAASAALTPEMTGRGDYVAGALLRGLWFDNAMACYVLTLPLLVALVAAWRGRLTRRLVKFLVWWFGVVYVLVFMAEASNIPYFSYFTKSLNSSIWNWAEYGAMSAGMLFGETSYYFYIFSFFVAATVFWVVLVKCSRRLAHRLSEADEPGVAAAEQRQAGWWTAGATAFCLLGAYGGAWGTNLRVKDAFFTPSPVYNNMGLNPMYALAASCIDDLKADKTHLNLMDETTAVGQAQTLLGRQGLADVSPIAREICPTDTMDRRNVVVVLMESMSAKLMGRFGERSGLTPSLDSLWQKSLTFPNCYSSGNHTNHGLYATLFSYPSILKRNAFKERAHLRYNGLPQVLKEHGYATFFFMPHDPEYDNMEQALRSGGFDWIVSERDFPKSDVVNNFGVSDSCLFSKAVSVLREQAKTGRPFMATLLTVSNHPPYCLPEGFKAKHGAPEFSIVEYADHCIGRFMDEVSREPWADNTIFVFLGDHGKTVGPADCALPEAYNHIPLIIYGKGIAPREVSGMASQVDVAPTVLGLLRVPYVQNDLGIDLLRETRPATFYSADNILAARDSRHLFIYDDEIGLEYYYNIAADGRMTITRPAPAFDSLKNYCYTMLQTAECLLDRRQTAVPDAAKKRLKESKEKNSRKKSTP